MFDVRETLQSSPCIPVTQLPLAPQFKKPKELKLFPYQWLFEQDWKEKLELELELRNPIFFTFDKFVENVY